MKGIIFRKTCGGKECKKLIKENKTLSDDIKLKISLSMKKSHKDGKHSGWSFINKDINKRSYPEKWFVKNVLDKYNLYSKFTIKEKFSFHKYFLDFAFLEIKLDVEIDGQQHFRSIKSIEHDKERDKFLLKNGWKVCRIAWLELKNNPNDIINNFLNWINKDYNYRKYDIDEILNLLKSKIPVYGNIEKYNKARKNISYLRNKPIIEMIEYSDIDFSKFGWVKKISELTGIKSQRVNKWMIKNMNNFYDKKCFKKRPHSLIG